MEKVLHIQKLLLRSTRMQGLILGVTLLILAGIILLGGLQLREAIREQIAGRDGEVLHAVALMQQLDEESDPGLGSIADPGNQLLVILQTSKLKGVLAARLYDVEGRFAESFPLNVREGSLPLEDMDSLRALKPVSHFRPAVPLRSVFYPEAAALTNAASVPLLEVNVPLHEAAGTGLVGIAQFLISGHGLASEFAQLDRHLAVQGLLAFLAAAAIIVATMVLAFRKLRQAHLLIEQRTNNLLQANQELALAAKTSALGAVTAHLIHGLKNPLFGLQTYVSSLGQNKNGEPAPDWQEAVAFTRRMQNMINEIVSVLRDQEDTNQYELTLAEMVEILSNRLEPAVSQLGISLTTRIETTGAFPSRVANLVILILHNLLQNGLEATPKGKSLHFTIGRKGNGFLFEVSDPGPGVPEAFIKNPFQPCRSQKEGGSGLGLAISKQLANHLGASLDLKSSGPQGSTFSLWLPESCAAGTPAQAIAETRA